MARQTLVDRPIQLICIWISISLKYVKVLWCTAMESVISGLLDLVLAHLRNSRFGTGPFWKCVEKAGF